MSYQGFRNGCKVAVISESGNVLATGKIFPNLTQLSLSQQDLDFLTANVKEHGVNIFAIGNGTASREVERLLGQLIDQGKFKPNKIVFTQVNEQGVSIYRQGFWVQICFTRFKYV